MTYDAVILGSGPAGFEAARRIARNGRRTALVTASPPGGRATVGSLLPSKGWLHHAEHLSTAADTDVADAAVLNAAAAIRTTIADRVAWTTAALENAGVEIVHGHGTVTGPNSIVVTSGDEEGTPRELTASAIILATGSEPIFFPGVRPDGDRVIAPRHTQNLSARPASMVMVGGGVTGVEYASVFARMGTRVHLLSLEPLLPRIDREYVARLSDVLAELGVAAETGVAVRSVENTGSGVVVTTADDRRLEAEMAFIATGRAGDLTFLGDGAPDLARTADGQFLAVDDEGRTSIPSIFACGDITGPPLTATRAVLQGRRVATAVANLISGDGDRTSGRGNTARDTTAPETATAGRTAAFIEAVYTDPQIAQIGPVLELAERTDLTVTRQTYAGSMRAHAHRRTEGELRIWSDDAGSILGAAAFGELAAEVLAPVQLAMHTGTRLGTLQEVPFAYPSVTEVVTM